MKKLFLFFMVLSLIIPFFAGIFAEDTDREKYEVSITLDPLANGKTEYYSITQILLYANMSISGGSTTLDRGGYLKLSIPKNVFEVPNKRRYFR